MRPALLLLLLLSGCGLTREKLSCWPYLEVWASNALGDVPGASMVLATYETSVDGCAAVGSILKQRPEPYSDMFPHQESLAATQ